MIFGVRKFSNSNRPAAICLSLAVLFLGACASQTEPVLSKLDPRTMVTINYIKSPFIFFRNAAAAHIDAREFVYVGPLEANRSGDYRYYLWLATWNTIDSGQLDPPIERLASIDLVADGKTLTLTMNGASNGAVGASEAVYPKPVGWATEVYYDVSLEQLRTIAEASELRLRLPATGEAYGPWDDQRASKAGLTEFLLRAET